MTEQSVKVVGKYLARQARMLARACAPDDREAALAFAAVLAKRPAAALGKGKGAAA